MVKNVGLVVSGMSVSSGIAAVLLLLSNLVVWAVIAASLGSLLAFVGFGLIVWALSVRTETSAADAPAAPPVPAPVIAPVPVT